MKNQFLSLTLCAFFGLGAAIAAQAPQDQPAAQQDPQANGQHNERRPADPNRQLQFLTKKLNLSSDQQSRLLPRIAPPADKLRRAQPSAQQREVAARRRSEGVGRGLCGHRSAPCDKRSSTPPVSLKWSGSMRKAIRSRTKPACFELIGRFGRRMGSAPGCPRGIFDEGFAGHSPLAYDSRPLLR